MRLRILLGVATLKVLLSATALLGAEARLELEADLSWSGTPTQLRVDVIDPTSNVVACDVPAVPGLTFEGPFRASQQTSIVNGRRSQSLSIPYRLTPDAGRKGKFTIGPARVRCEDGTVLVTKPVELLVYDRPEIGVHMDTQLLPAEGPIGASFRVIYTIHYYGETASEDDGFFLMRRGGGLGLSALELPVLALSGARVEAIQTLAHREAQTLSLEDKQQAILQRSAAEKNGKGYLTYVLGFNVTPFQPGPIELGGARASMQLKTGRTVPQRDVFGRRFQGEELKVFSAESASAVYQVYPLPTEGRPAGFNGAVGQYRISVTASPTEVDEGAPITVEIRVTGTGLVEELNPPIWTEIQSLTRDFAVSSDVDSGKLDQGAKVFRQLIRPQSSRIKAIPPIPFPYYDPAQKKYQVAQSEAIPIQVRAVKVVGADAAVATPKGTVAPMVQPRISGSPAITDQDGIGANFETIGTARPVLDPRDEVLSPFFLTSIAGPPICLAAIALLRRWRRRDPAQRRRAAAWSQALAALGTTSEPAAVARVCETYFRERLGLPMGEVTPADTRSALEHCGAPATLRDQVAELLERAQASRFGAAGLAAGSLTDDARRILQEVEGCLRG